MEERHCVLKVGVNVVEVEAVVRRTQWVVCDLVGEGFVEHVLDACQELHFAVIKAIEISLATIGLSVWPTQLVLEVAMKKDLRRDWQ